MIVAKYLNKAKLTRNIDLGSVKDIQFIVVGKAWQGGGMRLLVHISADQEAQFTFYWYNATCVQSGASVDLDTFPQTYPEVILIQPSDNGFSVKIIHHKMVSV